MTKSPRRPRDGALAAQTGPGSANPAVAGSKAAGSDPVTPLSRKDSGWPEPAVRLRDARSLRAFAHPVRVALMSALRSYGPLTATQAADYVGDSPSNCSFHLRTLGSFGLIEQVAGADHRQRPWRAVEGAVSFDPGESAESRAAWSAASDVLHGQLLDEFAQWTRREEEAAPEWRAAWFDSNSTALLTAAELQVISRKIAALLQPYMERTGQRRRTGTEVEGEQPVRIVTFAYPTEPPRHQPAVPTSAERETERTAPAQRERLPRTPSADEANH